MVKRAITDEDDASRNESGGEVSPPPKKAKTTAQKKGVKKTEKAKTPGSDESSPSTTEGKKGKKGNASKNVLSNAEGEKFIDLGKKRRATIRSFKGQLLIDIREFYGDEDDLKPGKKGISLSPEQWEVLKSNAATIDDLIKKL
ncbi:PC4-domain-containing protein [Phellopilus nigrolimitatus]|nr:PC4-domain-containing protein [Phellopilus nigrolimitatus]